MARIVHTENGVSREYTLGDIPITVGRAARHTIPTMDSRASRDHFKIENSGGRYVAEDTGSRNGTLLNGEPLVGQRTLKPGDRLMIGAAVFQFLDGTITTPAPDSAPAAFSPHAPSAPAAAPADAPAVAAAAAASMAPPPPSVRASIEVTLGDGSGLTRLLGATPVVIGRTPECDITIDDEKLSSRHAEVSETDQGVLVKDLKSTNGTKVDGQAFEARLFRDGEVFTAGSASFRICAPRFPSAARKGSRLRRPGPLALAIFSALLILGGAAVVAPSIIRKFLDVPPPVTADPGNLLGEAGALEHGADGWTIAYNAKYQFDADRDQHKDGGFSLRVRGIDTREHSLFAASSPAVAVNPTGAVKLEGWVRAQALEGRGGFRIEWLKSGQVVGTTTTDLLDGTFDWRRLSVVAVPPPGADQARAACLIAGLASVTWFDAVKLSVTKETPGGAAWGTPWGRMTIDDAAALRLDLPESPLLWNGTMFFEEKGLPLSPAALWNGAKDGEAQSVGTAFRVTRKLGRYGSVTLIGVHAEAEDSIAWQVDVAREGTVIFSADLDPAVAARITTRAGEIIDPRDGPFEATGCEELVLGDAPSLVFDAPADVKLEGTRLTLRWPKAAEIAIHLRAAPSWVEREVKIILADATASARAGQLGKALTLFDDLGRRFASRPEGQTGATKAKDLRTQGDAESKRAREEVDMALKFGGDLNRQRALDLVDGLERQWQGTDYAAEGARLRKKLSPDSPKPPDDPGPKPPDGPKPPEKEPIESARSLLKWAEEALAKEEYLKAEIFARNVIDRWPGTPEEMQAGELLGRATSGGKAALERDNWIRETLGRARNLVKNRQSDKAVPLFEEVLKKYPDSPLVKGVKEELDKLRR
ncbi:MAG: FHA domain-containing protein [Planctomycetes bacterium]|nr:FHA domain-containing protein [Planctomycetota bacterium]